MNTKYLIWAAVAVGGFIAYKKFVKPAVAQSRLTAARSAVNQGITAGQTIATQGLTQFETAASAALTGLFQSGGSTAVTPQNAPAYAPAQTNPTGTDDNSGGDPTSLDSSQEDYYSSGAYEQTMYDAYGTGIPDQQTSSDSGLGTWDDSSSAT